ncbi:hypothetical protein CC78DRAFT_124606 [Lojkania enalia]|uniref:DUF6535 domain-containing protein n=1 Tax=Lojkania enalia TaxID=147567 RepID=A0A9P4N140_9PLEO|nr:hypothetical protein CC78DRAFT_124606 [Didymosphaeria enalia]
MTNQDIHGYAPPTPQDIEYRIRLCWRILGHIAAVITAPYRRTFKLYTWKPLREIRAAVGDRRLLIAKIKGFKADKYEELQSVQVASSFCTGATLATITWECRTEPPWPVYALWYGSLVSGIFAVITSIQVKSMLDDLPDTEQLNANLSESELQRTQRAILRYRKRPGPSHWIMLFIWQFPSMTMSYAWSTFLAGLTLYICTPFIHKEPWSDRHRIAIAYLVIGGIGFLTYVSSSAFVYTSEKDYERSINNSKANTVDEEAGMSSVNVRRDSSRRLQGSSSTAADPIQTLRLKAFSESEIDSRFRQDRRDSGYSRPRLLI